VLASLGTVLLRVYLDADVVLSRRALSALALAARNDSSALLLAPQPLVCLPTRALPRAYARVWSNLPSVAGDVVGAGCYAVNSAGRARWNNFEPFIADDAFVKSRFARHERILVKNAHFLFRFPDGPGYVDVLSRWRKGNRQLLETRNADGSVHGASSVLNSLAVVARLWNVSLGYLLVYIAIIVRGRRLSEEWPRARFTGHARRMATEPVDSLEPDVTVIVVTYNSEREIVDCLQSLFIALRERGGVKVIDNNSTDGTVSTVRRAFPCVEMIRNETNVGFGAAVNAAASEAATEFIAIVNPDTLLDPEAFDSLFEVAEEYPAAAVYGGLAIDSSGRPDMTSCFAGPSLWQAITFGTGVSSVVSGAPIFDPDSLGAWRRDAVRMVPAVIGSLMLVRSAVFERVAGFDEDFFLYGEDVDFCLRVWEHGYGVVFTPAARYCHTGGASSSVSSRMAMILAGRATLYRKHLRPWSAETARLLLRCGVALRGFGEYLLRRPGPDAGVWRAAWKVREAWSGGWT